MAVLWCGSLVRRPRARARPFLALTDLIEKETRDKLWLTRTRPVSPAFVSYLIVYHSWSLFHLCVFLLLCYREEWGVSLLAESLISGETTLTCGTRITYG